MKTETILLIGGVAIIAWYLYSKSQNANNPSLYAQQIAAQQAATQQLYADNAKGVLLASGTSAASSIVAGVGNAIAGMFTGGSGVSLPTEQDDSTGGYGYTDTSGED